MKNVSSLSRTEITDWLTETLQSQELVGTEHITADTQLLGQGIGLDSVEVLRIVVAIENEFELTLEDDDLDFQHFQTVDTIADFVIRSLDQAC